ncbi:MAG TPA: alpha/beta fold hydrolase [Phycisphaerae bacterium]|nr:alpha/beta fold hydrolase [Phycisphaerae bacterium]
MVGCEVFAAGALEGLWYTIVHNWALTSILFTIFLLLVIPALILGKYVRICLNIIRDTDPPFSMVQTGFTPLRGDDSDFFAADGIRLRGTLIRASNKLSRGLIIFAPEFKSTRHSAARYCRPLIAAGFDIFTFDFRGHGDSASEEGYTPRQWTSDREVSDMVAAISVAEHWLEQQGRPAEVGVFGISRGACSCVLAAEVCPSVKAILCDGAFSSDCTLEFLMRKLACIFAKVRIIYENHPPEFWCFLRWCVMLTCRIKFKCRFPSVRKTLTRILPRPILFIHGERDSYIPVEQSRLLYAQSPQPRYLWVVARAKHNQSVDLQPELYAQHSIHFFSRYLGGQAEADNLFRPIRFAEFAHSDRPFHHISVAAGREVAVDPRGRVLEGPAEEDSDAEVDLAALAGIDITNN